MGSNPIVSAIFSLAAASLRPTPLRGRPDRLAAVARWRSEFELRPNFRHLSSCELSALVRLWTGVDNHISVGARKPPMMQSPPLAEEAIRECVSCPGRSQF